MHRRISVICIIILTCFLSSLAAQAQPEDQTTIHAITYTDSMDRTVHLSATPERIVSMAPNITETIAALGAKERLVGRTDYCNYPADIVSVESIGTLYNPSIEKLVSLSPDLVIASSFVNDQILGALEQASIPIVCIDMQDSFAGTYRMIGDIAYLLGTESSGAEVIATIQDQVETTQRKISNLPKRRVYYVVDFGSFDATATGDTYIGQMIDMAGGENIAKDATNWTYSKELLIDQDPDAIIIGSRWGESPEQTVEAFSTTKPYSDLRAVRTNHLVGIDADLISRQGPRSGLALAALARAIHGDAFE